MKFIFILFALSLSFFSVNAQNINLAWAKNLGSTETDNGLSIAVDASGNVYTAGYFRGTVDFDPGAGTTNLTSAGGTDIFISKLDASGNFVWVKSIGSDGDDFAQSIAIDASGNAHTTGYFSGTVDFDPGAGVTSFTSGFGSNIFISKLDASGNFVWARNIGEDFSYDYGRSIAVDAFGNVYLTGSYEGTVDFDPGAGSVPLTAIAGFDIFVLKLNASGNFLWAQSMGGNSFDVGYSIALDLSGNALVTGVFSDAGDFDPSAGTANLTSAGGTDIFVSKLNTTGGFVWAKRMGSSLDDFGRGVAVDVSGSVHTTGYFNGTVDFDPGAATANLTSAGSGDIFVGKLDAAGNYAWAKNFGGASFDNGNSIVVDPSGNVYTTGGFSGTVDFNPGSGTNTLTSAGSADIFISKLDASGNYIEAKNVGGTLSDGGNSIKVDLSNNLYITGDLRGTADFDPNAGTTNLTSAGEVDAYVVKLTQAGSLPVTLTTVNAYEKNGGVQVEWTTQQEFNIDFYEVERSGNGQQFARLGAVAAKGNRTTVTKYNFFNPSLIGGISFYRLKILEKSGEVSYSQIMKVDQRRGAPKVTLYPNPIRGNTVALQLNNFNKGNYFLSVTNKLGQQLIGKQIIHAGGSATQTIDISKIIENGIYHLRLTGEGVDVVQQILKN